MPNLQRGGPCLNFAHFSLQFCNPGDPKGGHGPMAPLNTPLDPNSPTAEDEWKFWLKTFTNFVEAMPAGEGEAQINKLNVAYEKARALELAKQTSETYFPHVVNSAKVLANRSAVDSDEPSEPSCSAAAVSRQSKISNKRTFMCYFCGGRNWHRRAKCPARDEKYDFRGKIGHYMKCCMSRKRMCEFRMCDHRMCEFTLFVVIIRPTFVFS